MQEKLTLLGCSEVFKAVPPLAESLLGIKTSESQVYRIFSAASEALGEADLKSPSEPLVSLETDHQELIYGMVDGSMLFTDNSWQESKVGRVFKGVPRQSKAKKYHSWNITHYEYVAKRGHWKFFAKEFERLLPPKSSCQKCSSPMVRYVAYGYFRSTLMHCLSMSVKSSQRLFRTRVLPFCSGSNYNEFFRSSP